MEQEKIGKFIQEKRKEKNLKQSDLAEKLGVSNRAVSKWENGLNMPDLSLFKPLCEILDISINELMSGEEIKEKDYQKKLEENIINVTEYKNKKEKDILGFFIYLFVGIFLLIFGLTFHEGKLWVPYMFEISSIIFILYATYRLSKILNKILNISILLLVFLFVFSIIKYFDFDMMNDFHLPPRYYYKKIVTDKCTIYKSLYQSGYQNNDYGKEVYLIIGSDEYEKVLKTCNYK